MILWDNTLDYYINTQLKYKNISTEKVQTNFTKMTTCKVLWKCYVSLNTRTVKTDNFHHNTQKQNWFCHLFCKFIGQRNLPGQTFIFKFFLHIFYAAMNQLNWKCLHVVVLSYYDIVMLRKKIIFSKSIFFSSELEKLVNSFVRNITQIYDCYVRILL